LQIKHMALIDRLKQHILTPHCVECGSFSLDDSLMCQNCFSLFIDISFAHESEIMKEENQLKIQRRSNTDINYLFDWGNKNQKMCSEIIYRIKNSRCRPTISFYAKILYSKLSMEGFIQNISAIVPVPGSTEKSNLAETIAGEIGILSNIPIEKWIARRSPEASQNTQKSLNLEQRKNRNRFVLNCPIEKISKNPSETKSHVMLVDDVITTGETINECSRLLERHFSVKASAFFYREKN
jgi:predicted amidophosphoribosyltransferase